MMFASFVSSVQAGEMQNSVYTDVGEWEENTQSPAVEGKSPSKPQSHLLRQP